MAFRKFAKKLIFNKRGVKIIFRINSKLKKFIKLGNDIGEQSSKIRIVEHRNNIKLSKKYYNVVSEHLKDNEDEQENHFIQWDEI